MHGEGRSNDTFTQRLAYGGTLIPLIPLFTAVADSYIKISSVLVQMSPLDGPHMDKFLGKIAECFEKARKIEGRASSDEDLKLSDTFRYYMKDTSAAKVGI